LALPVYFTLYVHVVSALLPIGAPAEESPGTMFVIVQVTDVGVPAPTVTVPAVKFWVLLLPVPLNRPNDTPPTRVATAPIVTATAPASASRILIDLVISFPPLYLFAIFEIG
jgi:hypothetical protein